MGNRYDEIKAIKQKEKYEANKMKIKESTVINELEKVIKKAAKPLRGMPMAFSGGIDSSTLACFVKPKYCITIESIGGDAYNETKYTKIAAEALNLDLRIISTESHDFKESVKEAIKIIGKPTPHFNIFPLYVMFKTLFNYGETDIVIADGPDESMCGYARDIIYHHIMKLYEFEALEPYHPLVQKVIPSSTNLYAKLSNLSEEKIKDMNTDNKFVNRVNMSFKREEMDIMSARLADHFGIKIHKPYETDEVDQFMLNLPLELKVRGEYGKYALRKIASKYLPNEIAWRKVKRGGPIYPVNKVMGWDKKDGEYGKNEWVKFQKKILNG